MKYLSITLSVLILFFFGCGEEMDQVNETIEVAKNAKEIATNMEKNVSKAEKRMEKRKEIGDTLAMNYKELQKYLPESIEGYTAKKPEGQSSQMGVYSFSQARREYVKDTPEGKSYVKIEIMDYNQTHQMFMGITSAWSSKMKFEDDMMIEQTFDPDIENTTAFESYNKKRNEAKVTYAVAWRFIIEARANNQEGTDFLKKVVSKMDLKELSKM